MNRNEAIAKALGIQADIASRASEAPREIYRTLTEANKVIPDRVLANFDEAIREGSIAKMLETADEQTIAAVSVLVRTWVEHLADAYVELADRMRVKAIELDARAKTLVEVSGIVARAADVDSQATGDTPPEQ